ncbi:MAG: thioether cross-link-forming SCIFF peptide maturase [Firmicutes bacterium]|nr:thioether cross-link-forming SCIFF peptide maturase [Bacillota bacterium]MCL2255484.1 thioether cross-link-forming SCIFF peptide maturase [Bacillota bacterium]
MVHTFKCLDKIFALDVDSGSLFEIDELTRKLIENRKGDSKELLSSFSVSDTKSADAEIEALIKEGVLFSNHELVEPLNESVVKSMCLNVTYDCNLACSYCFADLNLRKNSHMSIETAKNAVDFLIQKSGHRHMLEIDFFGGEAILNFSVVKETIDYARIQAKKIGKEFRFTITTNAYALSDKVIEYFNENMFNVVISIDGRKEIHDAMRKTEKGHPSHDIAVQNALKFVKSRGNKQYYIRGTFTRLNKDFAVDAMELFKLGFNQISLEPVVLPYDHPLSLRHEDILELSAEYEKLAREYQKLRANNNDVNFFHFNIDLSGGPCETKRLRNCGAGCEYVGISPNGDIYPCHQFVVPEFKMGNVNTNKFNYSTPLEKNSILNKPECLECWAKYFCSGGCIANSHHYEKTLFTPHFVSCELLKKRTECALALKE